MSVSTYDSNNWNIIEVMNSSQNLHHLTSSHHQQKILKCYSFWYTHSTTFVRTKCCLKYTSDNIKEIIWQKQQSTTNFFSNFKVSIACGTKTVRFFIVMSSDKDVANVINLVLYEPFFSTTHRFWDIVRKLKRDLSGTSFNLFQIWEGLFYTLYRGSSPTHS